MCPFHNIVSCYLKDTFRLLHSADYGSVEGSATWQSDDLFGPTIVGNSDIWVVVNGSFRWDQPNIVPTHQSFFLPFINLYYSAGNTIYSRCDSDMGCAIVPGTDDIICRAAVTTWILFIFRKPIKKGYLIRFLSTNVTNHFISSSRKEKQKADLRPFLNWYDTTIANK